MPRDPEELNTQARVAADSAVTQFKSKVQITATCPACENLISVVYDSPGDAFVTKCKCSRSNLFLRGVRGPPDWLLSERDYYLKKAAGAGVLDATFYAMYFTDCKFGSYFDCSIDPRLLSPNASEDVIADAVNRSKRLCHGQNAYVGAAFFKYADSTLTYEEAVRKLRSDNPGFCEDVYTVVINDNIKGMR